MSAKSIALIILAASANIGHSVRAGLDVLELDVGEGELLAESNTTGACTDKAERGVWDYNCYKRLMGGSSYHKKYCEAKASQITSTTGGSFGGRNTALSDHCAENFDSYCTKLAEHGIYFWKCRGPGCGAHCDRNKDAKDYVKTICDLSGHSSVSAWLAAVGGTTCANEGQRDTPKCLDHLYKMCIKDSSVDFCKAIKATGFVEKACWSRITHRDDNDDYCKCTVLGNGYGDEKIMRCNEKQDRTNEMDVWDNECLRTCSGYPQERLGWQCDPVAKPVGGFVMSSYKGSLTTFGRQPSHLRDSIDSFW
jgi:hypothetical protein